MRQPNQWERPSAHNPRKNYCVGFYCLQRWASHILFQLSSLAINHRCCNWLNCGEILRQICQEMPSEYHFQSVLTIPHRAAFSPGLSWLTDLFRSFWVPGTGLQRCAAGGDYPWMGVGSANPSSPLQPLLLLFKEHFGEVKNLLAFPSSRLPQNNVSCHINIREPL